MPNTRLGPQRPFLWDGDLLRAGHAVHLEANRRLIEMLDRHLWLTTKRRLFDFRAVAKLA